MRITEDEKDELIVVNAKTGEVLEDARIVTKEMDKAIARNKAKNKVIEVEFEKYGHFYWLFYDIQEALFNGKIDGITATRLIYLATYLSYKDNMLMYSNKQPVLTEQLPDLLGIGKRACYNFINKCKEAKMISVRPDNTLTISKEYFSRGKLSKKQIYGEKYIMRMYVDTIRYLYENSEDRYKRGLSYLYAVLPWVNRDYNIVCSNPTETNLNDVIPLSTAEFCEVVGLEPTRAQCARLRNILLPIKIDGKPVVGWVLNANGDRIFINPRVYYAGKKADEVKILGKF